MAIQLAFSSSLFRPACSRQAKARLQGCTPAWMQVVEPRLEQAAEESSREVVEW